MTGLGLLTRGMLGGGGGLSVSVKIPIGRLRGRLRAAVGRLRGRVRKGA